jgi:hypothetical protein
MGNPDRQPEIDTEPSADAADWLALDPSDLHPYGFEPRVDPEAACQLVLPEPEAG